MSHVQNIRQRFEALNLNSSDIVSLTADISPLKAVQKQLFRRSATLFEFSTSNHHNNNGNNSSEADSDNKEDVIFIRQHSDDSNSSYKSLRRSQAFRLDVQKKPSLATKPTTSKLKRQNAVKYQASPNSKTIFDDEKFLTSSDTIKKALKQPLPLGPAPKKPPRTFADSPRTSPMKENNNIVDDIEKSKIIDSNKQDSSILRICDHEKRSTTLPKSFEKKDDKKGISSFLNCIISPCSIDPIYYEQVKLERNRRRDDEKIYMEPYEHLNFMTENPKKTEELHYLCTNLIDQTNNNSSYSPNDKKNRSFLDNSNTETSDIESYEKINILMDFVYDEKNRDNMLEESSGSSEVEFKSPVPNVTRSLTEKRKNYVRRVTETRISTEKIITSNQQPTSASSIISRFQRIIDSNDGSSQQIQKKTDDKSLFKMVLLVGYDMMNQKGYIKSIYPKNETALPMLEEFIYPSSKFANELMTKENQNFTLILTDENGNNIFGYCKQIIAEGFEEKCLPLTYCVITKINASGFYFNLLREIESRHGYPEVQFSYMMRSLKNQELPTNGKVLHVKLFDSAKLKKLPEVTKRLDREALQKPSNHRNISKRLSLESPEWLKTHDTLPISRSQTESIKKSDEIMIKRANDVRMQNEELTVLYESTTKELLIAIFGSLLIERKVILLGSNISQITSCLTALYSLLYPFKWQHVLIACIPEKLTDLLEAPFPYFAGVLKKCIKNIDALEIEDGIIVDLDTKSLIRRCGDESTLVPETLKKSLLLSLKIVEAMDKGHKLKNVLISEAFLQFFVKLFSKLEAKTYKKNKFIETHDDQAIKYFLEWFLDTVMFKEFLSQKLNDDNLRASGQSSETYFELFNVKILEKSATLSGSLQKKNIEMLMKSSKHKKRNFKDRIKDFLKS